MAGISPVPTSRVSDPLLSQRLLQQIQSDQLELFKIQSQLTTGRRISVPSEDAAAAVRAITLQRQIENKEQIQVNLTTTQSYLSATDTALSSVSGILNSIRGDVVGVSGEGSRDIDRLAIAETITRAVAQLVNVGNQEFRGRSLFAGSRTTVDPFILGDKFVTYVGNEQRLASYVEVDLLQDSSINGNEVFGAISDPVRSTADLNPILTASTRLSQLHGGAGISKGSLSVSDGSSTKIIDISGAETIGDVAAFLQADPPDGRTVTATVTATGLTVAIDTAGGGEFTIREVGGGTTADELGLLKAVSSGTAPIVGTDLNPRLTLTTRLADILGVRASTELSSPGSDNDLIIEAVTRGPANNGATVQFVDDALLHPGPGLLAGNETVSYSTTAVAARASLSFDGSPNNDILLTATAAGTGTNGVTVSLVARAADGGGVLLNYDAGAKTYEISVEDGVTTAQNVVDAVVTDGGSGGPFTAALDTSVDATNDGSYVFVSADATTNAGSTGNSGAAADTLLINIQASATTANQVIQAINNDATVSQLFSASLSGRDTTNKVTAGSGAVDVAVSGVTSGGAGIEFDQQSGLQITSADQTHTISISTAETVEDLLNILNGSGAGVLAQINAQGNAIDVRSRISGADFAVGENGGTTATELGIRSLTPLTRLETLNYGRGVHTAAGDDLVIHRRDGVELHVDLSGAVTVGDVLDRINNHADNTPNAAQVVARTASFGNAIELVDVDPTGAGTLQVERTTFSQAAEDLGFVAVGANVSLDAQAPQPSTATVSLAGANNDLTFTASQAGTSLDGVSIQFINSAASGNTAIVNYDAGAKTLTIDVDPAATTAATILAQVNAEGTFSAQLSTAADAGNDGSGLVTETGTVATTAGGTDDVLSSGDINPLETAGVFNTLIRLADALTAGDERAVERGIAQLDNDLTRLNFARAEIGARGQVLDVMQVRVDTDVIELKEVLSLEIDVDLVEAISALTARQASFQASLQTAARSFQLSLLDFL